MRSSSRRRNRRMFARFSIFLSALSSTLGFAVVITLTAGSIAVAQNAATDPAQATRSGRTQPKASESGYKTGYEDQRYIDHHRYPARRSCGMLRGADGQDSDSRCAGARRGCV